MTTRLRTGRIDFDKPAAPTNLVLTDNGTYVQLDFNTSIADDAIHSIEIWRSETSSTEGFALIGKIYESGLSASISFDDDTFTKKTTLYYKIFTIRGNKYSTALTGNITVTGNVTDVSNLVVTASTEGFYLSWDNPIDPRLAYVEVKVDAKASSASLSEAAAVSTYQGLDTNMFYKIVSGQEDFYFKFWIYTITRT